MKLHLIGLSALVIAMLVLVTPASAVEPGEQLADPQLEMRAVQISRQLRCVVCQNETIDESDALLAHDLRIIVRERLRAGDTDTETINFIVRRYGDYVLLKPPFKPSTIVLWLGPLVLLSVGVSGISLFLGQRHAALLAATELTEEENVRIDQLLKSAE